MEQTKTKAKTKLGTKAIRILKLSAYCYPEQESSSHLTDDLYEAFVEAGFYIINYVPMPTRGVSEDVRKVYKKKKTEILYDGHLIIHRFPMFREGHNPVVRALRYVLVNIVQFWKGIHEKNIDVILSGSTPPTQGLLCAVVKNKLRKLTGRNVAMVFAIQDIFPDSLVTAGMARKNSYLWKLGNKVSDYAYKNADRIITISESMRRNLIDKKVPESKITVISNWIDTDTVDHIDDNNNPLFEQYSIDRKKFIAVYAGNIGASQGVEVIIEVARLLEKEKEILFVIFGKGAEYDRIVKDSASLENVMVNTLLPLDRVSEVYSLGDVALITCKKGAGNSGMPSKTWSIMACNTPIIVSYDLDSDLAKTLEESGAGVCVPPEEPEVFAEAVHSAFLKWKKAEGVRKDIRTYVINHADRKTCVQKYVNIINDCLISPKE